MIKVNRPPVLVLWATVVAERLGFDEEEALTLGRALARVHSRDERANTSGTLMADQFVPSLESVGRRRYELPQGEVLEVGMMRRTLRVMHTGKGFRAICRTRPTNPEAVRKYLVTKFGNELDRVSAAMTLLAASMPRHELSKRALELYEGFRPKNGLLDLVCIGGVSPPVTPAHSADMAAQSPNRTGSNRTALPNVFGLRNGVGYPQHPPRPQNRPQQPMLLTEQLLLRDGRHEIDRSEPDTKHTALTLPPSPDRSPHVQAMRRYHTGSRGYPRLPVLLLICTIATFFGGGAGSYLTNAFQNHVTQTEIRHAVDVALAPTRQESSVVGERDEHSAATPTSTDASSVSLLGTELAWHPIAAATSLPARPEGTSDGATDRAALRRLLDEAEREIEDQRLDQPEGENVLDTFRALAAKWPDSAEVALLRDRLRSIFLSLWVKAIAAGQWEKRAHYLAVAESLGGNIPPVPTRSDTGATRP
jgi:hypothetical protein